MQKVKQPQQPTQFLYGFANCLKENATTLATNVSVFNAYLCLSYRTRQLAAQLVSATSTALVHHLKLASVSIYPVNPVSKWF